ncbi:MAG: acyl carrier protein [Deltaproteobacteria bacterium]|nr:acyl carrier protein [Deltaproteobacteria bacterium]
MNSKINNPIFSKDAILKDVITILKDLTYDWDLEFSDPIGPDTKFVADLGFESIDIVQFIVAIEEHFQRRGLPFENLIMVDGRYVDEIKLGDTVAFLFSHLNDQ